MPQLHRHSQHAAAARVCHCTAFRLVQDRRCRSGGCMCRRGSLRSGDQRGLGARLADRASAGPCWSAPQAPRLHLTVAPACQQDASRLRRCCFTAWMPFKWARCQLRGAAHVYTLRRVRQRWAQPGRPLHRPLPLSDQECPSLSASSLQSVLRLEQFSVPLQRPAAGSRSSLCPCSCRRRNNAAGCLGDDEASFMQLGGPANAGWRRCLIAAVLGNAHMAPVSTV